jgi:hypothetical protein
MNGQAQMTPFNQYLQDLATISGMSLRFRPKTAAPALLLRSMSERAAGISRSELLQLRENIDQAMSSKLMYMGVLAAEQCVNTADPAWLRASVFAHVLEGFKFDFRENYLRLYASEYAGWLAKTDVRAAVDAFSDLIDSIERAHYEGVFDEPHQERALVMAQLKAIEVDGEFRFAPKD